MAETRPTPDPHAPLAGVPLAIKDLFCVEGVPSAAASRILEGHRPAYTATSVRKLADAGAPMLGKTNMDEFAMGSSNENSGFGPVQNPWDRERVPGGSSGGSAAAVAAGLAPWAIGTDTGGSIRQPASLCGLAGLKPTYGAVSRYGMIAFASSLDQAGPLTRDVKDAALLFRHMVGPRSLRLDLAGLPRRPGRAHRRAPRRHPLRPARQPHRRRRGAGGAGGLREHARPRSRSWAAQVEQIELPNADHGLSAYYLLAPAEASANLARYDGVRFGMRSGNGDLLSMYEDTRGDGFGDEVKRRIMLGTYALSSGYYDALYGKAQRVRTKIAEDFAKAFEKVDVIVTPTSPSVAFKLGERTGDPYSMYLSDYFTVPMSLAGIPALSIPGGPVRGPAGGDPAGRARVLGGQAARRRPRAGAGHRLRREPRAWLSRPTASSRSSAWRSTSSSGRGRRCSAAARCPSATSPTPTPARSAWATRARCR